MSDANEATNDLISRLAVIDGQPLETRAVAFAHVHDELRAVLDGGRQASTGVA
ncbi:hypothetical protein EDF46_0004 [Frondihabitans sp. PhB188]|uniref:hypothetical protein n=1 Tax=Frondihabitans sp. PhB188 TaxID=2485200 RepID=UPI000FAF515A|nr:hypothetical protein [Frondihabitans sp. PhB188]ROQ40646.1 hypothetical protein EDF46_0004 [Frondihabitans sp. PhB188]